jgi:hypothetical protein
MSRPSKFSVNRKSFNTEISNNFLSVYLQFFYTVGEFRTVQGIKPLSRPAAQMIRTMFGFVRTELRDENIQGNIKPPL